MPRPFARVISDPFVPGRLIGWLGVLVIVAFFAKMADARTIIVPDDEPTVAAGIAAAYQGDIVRVEPGTYLEPGLVIQRGITLTSVDPDDPAVVAATIIDGCAAGRILTIQNRLQVATVQGLTFQNGYAMSGAGIYLNYTIPTIRNCVFRNCVAVSQGGAVSYTDSSQEPAFATFDGCTFIENSAVNGGSAFYAQYASPNLLNCTVTGNDGSALKFVFCPEPVLANCIVDQNEVGMYCYESSPTVTNSTFAENAQGIYVSVSGKPDLTNCIVRGGAITLSGVFASAEATFSNIEGSWPGLGNIDADPLFVDYRGHEYALKPGSPAIDAGDPTIEDGINWPGRYNNGARSDMGAYGGPGNVNWRN